MPQIWVLFPDAFLFYCTLYTDFPGAKTAAIARHVSSNYLCSLRCVRHLVRHCSANEYKTIGLNQQGKLNVERKTGAVGKKK